jgi:hypothetical protein
MAFETAKDLSKRFEYHPPKTQTVIEMHQDVRSECLSMALSLNQTLPDGREKALAITKLEEVMFWANAAIAREISA